MSTCAPHLKSFLVAHGDQCVLAIIYEVVSLGDCELWNVT